MVQRTKRMLPEHEAEQLLHRVGAWRQDCVSTLARVPIHHPVYPAVSGVMDAIDGVAEALTGSREHFWLKPHSIKSQA